jgi:hypothetical protein
MFSFRNSRQPTDHDADGYRPGERDGKAAPLSPGIAVAATEFVQIRDWSRNCLTSLLVGHNMRDVPSAKAANLRGICLPNGILAALAIAKGSGERFALAFCDVEGAELDHAAGATG